MRTALWASLALAVMFGDRVACGQSADEKSGGWRTIFDGKSLDGWEHIGPGKMVLQDGLMRTEGGMGLLWYTKKKFGDCVIRVVYRTKDKRANSGVYVRIADKPKDPWYAVHHGYEVQISDADDEFHGTGAIYSLSKATARPVNPPGEWNTMEIMLHGEEIIVMINGGEVNDFNPKTAQVPERTKDYEPERGPRPTSGYIGLQNHGDVTHDAVVEFKEVSVRPLGPEDKPER
ncbi:MAG: 3-keto-disaccharide hydrolase [Isosphaeraceae bacterium]